jgi:xanthine dehydrogenase accessory factor
MLVGPDGSVVGSVSGDCVEADLYEVAQEVVASGVPALQRYGVSGSDTYAVGLSCGGTIDVFIEPVSRTNYPDLADMAAAVRDGRPIAVATVIEHPVTTRIGRRLMIEAETGEPRGTTGSAQADAAIDKDARGLLASGRPGLLTYGPDGERQGDEMRVFVASHAPRPRMLIFGAIDTVAALATLATFVGYRVTVCDARPLFATRARFPEADEVVVDWPHRYLASQQQKGSIDARTVVCVLTHDPKFDVPVLEVALRLPEVAYIGAMGSRSTHVERLRRLREAGLTDAELTRLSSPIGLDLGARTPEDTAVSVIAEVIGRRYGGQGCRLTELTGRIHHQSS